MTTQQQDKTMMNNLNTSSSNNNNNNSDRRQLGWIPQNIKFSSLDADDANTKMMSEPLHHLLYDEDYGDNSRRGARLTRSDSNNSEELSLGVDGPTPMGNVDVVDQLGPKEFLKSHRTDQYMLDNLRPLLTNEEDEDNDDDGGMNNDDDNNDDEIYDVDDYDDRCNTMKYNRQTSLNISDFGDDDEGVDFDFDDSNNTATGANNNSQSFAQVPPMTTLSSTLPPPTAATASSKKTSSKSNSAGPVKQCAQWKKRFEELTAYKQEHGHCSVPYNFEENPRLAQWVKRQRHQMKRKREGKHSNLSKEREDELTQLGFVWNAHKASWDQYFQELLSFKERFGHCNVPTKCEENPQLAVWVKLQRRQYRLTRNQPDTAPTVLNRMARLQSIGFEWNPRNLHM